MNLEKVIFAFFIVLAMSLNFSLVIGGQNSLEQHSVYQLFATLVANLICTFLKFGDKTNFGSTVLATSLAADLQLIVASILWGSVSIANHSQMDLETMSTIISIAAGALICNIVSVILLIIETTQIRK